jgi:hypothetical protein
VSGMWRNSSSSFCVCPTFAQAVVRSGIVVKEKDVFHISVRTNCANALSQFVSALSTVGAISTCLVVRCDCCSRPAASALVSDLCSTALKMPDPTFHSTHINGVLPIHTVQAPVNFYGTDLFDVTTLCFIRVSVTSAILRSLCIVIM